MASADVEFRCFVGGLAWATDDQALERAFSPYGDILESNFIKDRETGRSRGFGFVTFSNEKSMRDAIEGMDGQNLDGRNIAVNEAQSRSNGSGGGGGGYSGGEGGGGYGGGGGREGGAADTAEVAVTVDTETVAQGTQGAAAVAAVTVVAGGVRFVRNLLSVTLSLLVT